MNKFCITLVLISIMGIAAGCTIQNASTAPTPTLFHTVSPTPADCVKPDISQPTPVPTAEPAPFEGMWMSHFGEIFVVHGDQFYRRFFIDGNVYEQNGEVMSYDPVAQTIVIHLRRIRVNDVDGGFDYNEWLYRYQVDGEQLKFAVASMEYPAQVDPTIYELKIP